MKKTVSIILTIVMTLCMITNVFAAVTKLETATPVATIRIDGYEKSNNTNPGWYYYNPSDGKITFVAEGTSAEGKGNLIKPLQVNAKYAFTATTNGTTYHYQVLDEITGADGKKQYYIYCNDIYGKNPATDAANSAFDPEVETNVAYWLNNAFLNGTAGSSYVALDTVIKDYIQDHDWIVESNGKLDTEKYGSKDYSVNCKIALLSISEYAKYADKIGYGPYDGGSLSSAGLHMYLRSPSDSKNIRTLYAANGCTASTGTSNTNARIRPCFYVSEDYFKNVKLDLANMGSEVKKIVSELGADIYTDTEDKLALKGISVYTEDAAANLDTAKWTNAANATVANNIIEIKTGKWIARKINMQGGTVSIEADVNDASGSDLHIGFRYDTDTGGPDYKYPLYLSTVDENSNYPIRYYSKKNGAYDNGEYKRLENSYNGVKHSTSDKPFTLRLNVNLDTGMCYVAVISKNTDGESVVRYSTLADASKYINSTKAFQDVAFWNKSTSNTVKISNVKITYDQNSSAIKNVTATGSKKIEVEFADYANIDSVEKESVLVENNTVTGIEKKDGKLYATLANSLSQNAASIVINDIKVNGIESTGYTAIGNSTQFTYTAPAETVIGTPVISGGFTKDSVVSATCSVTPNGSDDIRKLQFVVAAYNGGRLIGAKFENIENVNKAESLTSSLVLLEDATEIRAFIWDDNNYPVRSFVMEKAQ